MLKALAASPWTGAVWSLVSASWEGFWLVGPPVGIDPGLRRWYLFWGLLSLMIAVTQAFVVLIRKNRTLELALKPKFDIVFLPENDEDSPPYLVDKTFVQAPQGIGDVAKLKRIRKYRIGV